VANYVSTLSGAAVEAALAGNAQGSMHYDQTGPSIVASTNISSVSDDATGQYTANFTANFATIQYFPTCIGITQPASVRGGGYMGFGGALTVDTRLTSAFQGATANAASAGADGSAIDLTNNIWRFAGVPA
jgi:hypothetical protein